MINTQFIKHKMFVDGECVKEFGKGINYALLIFGKRVGCPWLQPIGSIPKRGRQIKEGEGNDS